MHRGVFEIPTRDAIPCAGRLASTPKGRNPIVARCVGPYSIIGHLGTGGMAEVLLGEKRLPMGFTKRVAIKRPLPGAPEADARFRAEAVLAARLQHPNITQVYDFIESDSGWALVMEPIDGVTLEALLSHLTKARQPLPLEALLQIAGCISAALSYAHGLCDDAGTPLAVVHRDVSPQNIMIDRTGRVVLTDFGVASSRVGDLAPSLGKAQYAAPEQRDGRPASAASDQFGLGQVLWKCVAQADASTRAGQTPQAATLHRILGRCVRETPSERYPTMEALHTYLSALPCPDGAEVLKRMVHAMPSIPEPTGGATAQLGEAARTVRSYPRRAPLAAAAGLALLSMLVARTTGPEPTLPVHVPSQPAISARSRAVPRPEPRYELSDAAAFERALLQRASRRGRLEHQPQTR